MILAGENGDSRIVEGTMHAPAHRQYFLVAGESGICELKYRDGVLFLNRPSHRLSLGAFSGRGMGPPLRNARFPSSMRRI
jgi:hypothetical protein